MGTLSLLNKGVRALQRPNRQVTRRNFLKGMGQTAVAEYADSAPIKAVANAAKKAGKASAVGAAASPVKMSRRNFLRGGAVGAALKKKSPTITPRKKPLLGDEISRVGGITAGISPTVQAMKGIAKGAPVKKEVARQFAKARPHSTVKAIDAVAAPGLPSAIYKTSSLDNYIKFRNKRALQGAAIGGTVGAVGGYAKSKLQKKDNAKKDVAGGALLGAATGAGVGAYGAPKKMMEGVYSRSKESLRKHESDFTKTNQEINQKLHDHHDFLREFRSRPATPKVIRRMESASRGISKLHKSQDDALHKINQENFRHAGVEAIMKGNRKSKVDYLRKHAEAPLNKPMRTPEGPKKFKVYVKDPSSGNVKTVRFGDPNMKIKKHIPERKKSFRARHNCDNPGPRTKARYWSCKKW